MVKDLFDNLLEELGRVIAIPNLHPDRNNSCLINYPNGFKIQIEMDSQAQFMIIGTDLGHVPPGRYRENILREALKANALPPPLHGILAFSQKTDHLILFESLHTQHITGDRIADAIEPFKEKALKWKEALEKGEVPITATFRTSGGIFGLRP